MISIFMQEPPTRDAIRDQIQSQVQAEITAAQQGAGDAAAQRVVRIRTGQDGERTTTIALPPDFARNMIPPQVVDLGLAFFFTMAFIILDRSIRRANARAIGRPTIMKAIVKKKASPRSTTCGGIMFRAKSGGRAIVVVRSPS